MSHFTSVLFCHDTNGLLFRYSQMFVGLLHLLSTSYKKIIASWFLGMADFPDDAENLLVMQSDRCG